MRNVHSVKVILLHLLLLNIYCISFSGCMTLNLMRSEKTKIDRQIPIHANEIRVYRNESMDDKMKFAVSYTCEAVKSEEPSDVEKYFMDHDEGILVFEKDISNNQDICNAVKLNTNLFGPLKTDIANIAIQIRRQIEPDKSAQWLYNIGFVFSPFACKIEFVGEEQIDATHRINQLGPHSLTQIPAPPNPPCIDHFLYHHSVVNFLEEAYGPRVQAVWEDIKEAQWIGSDGGTYNKAASGVKYKGIILPVQYDVVDRDRKRITRRIKIDILKDQGSELGKNRRVEFHVSEKREVPSFYRNKLEPDGESVSLKNYNGNINISLRAESIKKEYDHPLAVRIVGAPFCVAGDILTSPFQLALYLFMRNLQW